MSARTKIEKLEELIKGSIDGEIVEQTLAPLVPPGENFGSVIYKVDFKVKNGENVETYHAVAKCTPPNKVTQELFNIQVTTKAEIGWYTTVIPTFKDFQREHGVEQVANFFQNFYGARISLDPTSDIVDIDAVILTENLKPLGYKNIDRHIGFDLKTSKAVLRDLATFHSVPIAIKYGNKELFDKNIKPFLTSFKEDPSIKDKDHFKDLKNEFQKIPEIAPYMDRIVTNLDNNKLYKDEVFTKEPWGSVCHKDFWINNIMVKEGDSPKTVFLDFQVSSYGSIAFDVLFFLATSVTQEVVADHMDELFKYYWDEFLDNLKHLNIEEPLFTYKEFLKLIDEEARSGLFGRSIFHTYMILKEKGHTDFDSSDENFKMEDLEKFDFTLNDKHKNKFTWLILEFVKRDWI